MTISLSFFLSVCPSRSCVHTAHANTMIHYDDAAANAGMTGDRTC